MLRFIIDVLRGPLRVLIRDGRGHKVIGDDIPLDPRRISARRAHQVAGMKEFITELGVVPSALDPMVIYCDNNGAIANAKEPRSHKNSKHIKRRFHSIREHVKDGDIKICKVHTDLNVADPLTKALPRAKHDQHQNSMGVRFM